MHQSFAPSNPASKGILIKEINSSSVKFSDPSNINLIGQWDGVYAAHACWVSDDGNTVFTGSEFSGGHIMSFDVSDINNINLIDSWMPENGELWSAHNLFRKDDYLYIAMGDGGSTGDPQNRAQNLTNLFGKILRINFTICRIKNQFTI